MLWKLSMYALLIGIVLLLLSTNEQSHSTGAYGATCETRCWQQRYNKQRIENKRLRRQVRALRSSTRTLAVRTAKWSSLARCESGGRWRYNGPSGFDGGLQFHPKTWRAFGGTTFASYAWGATPIQQVAIAQKVLKAQGKMAWPGCTRKGVW